MDFPKTVPGVGLVGDRFVDENATLGQPGSLIPSAWGNAVTLEILNVIEQAGMTPDEGATDQLKTAIAKLIEDGRQQPTGYEKVSLSKAYSGMPAFVKTGANTVSLRAGTAVDVPSLGRVDFTENTPVIMPGSLTVGDYSIWVTVEGTAQAVPDTLPGVASAPVPGAVKIGGFYYGPVLPGTTLASGGFDTVARPYLNYQWTQAALDLLVGVNAHSIWDLQWRPKCDPRGMTCITGGNGTPLFWSDIYFCGTNHLVDGTSKHGTNVLSGTVMPQRSLQRGGGTYTEMNYFVAAEIAFDHGKRLPSYSEFADLAYGVTELQSLGGSTTTIPATAFAAGYTSRVGVCQATGHHWVYGVNAHGSGSVGGAWATGVNRGETFGRPIRSLFGGSRENAAKSGSRCSGWYDLPINALWSEGLRAVCDHKAQ